MPEAQESSYAITLNALLTAMRGILPLMRDKNIFEVYANPDGKVWADKLGQGRTYTGIVLPVAERRQIILNVAALTNQLVKNDRPVIDADIPANRVFPKCRFEGNLPDVVSDPTFNIRKHPEKIFTLDDYLANSTISDVQYSFLKEAIKKKLNIIAAGGTKSGKTTFLNALLAEIAKTDDRVILIEDTPELQCAAKDFVAMRATRTFDMSDCLRQVLRMTPDRIVVGEVRSGEALALLDAWSTGHSGGCSTVHSNSARDTLLRLENMTARVSKNPQQATIAQAVNVVCYLKLVGNQRRLQEIMRVKGWDSANKKYDVQFLQ